MYVQLSSPKRQRWEIADSTKPQGEIINVDIEGTEIDIDSDNTM